LVDPDTLADSYNGDQAAVRIVCKLAAQHLTDMAARFIKSDDDLTPFVIHMLEKIAAGEDPNNAFGIGKGSGKRGRKSKKDDFLHWSLAQNVKSLINDYQLTREAALSLVQSALPLRFYSAESSGGLGATVEKEYYRWKDHPLAPLPHDSLPEVKAMENKIEQALIDKGISQQTK
jgi:hypothetical protein